MKTDRRSTVSWAVLGTGSISEQMTQDLLMTENAVIHAAASRDVSRAREFAKRNGIAAAGTFEQIIERNDVDVVYIGTPHVTHADFARRAMEAGKHVLVEKPAVVTASELVGLIDVARSSGVFFMEAMWMKFSPSYRALLSELDGGGIGAVRSVRASFGIPFPRDESSRWRAEMRGSALLDQGIYPVTLALATLGVPDRIRASGTVRSDGVDLTEQLTFEYDDGRFAQLASSMVEFIDPTASISGDRGWITIPFPFWATTRFLVHQPSSESFWAERSVEFPHEGHGYVPMLRAVGDAIRSGLTEHPWHTWQDALAVAGLLDSAREALMNTSDLPKIG